MSSSRSHTSDLAAVPPARLISPSSAPSAAVVVPPALPALVVGQVSHTRFHPIRHSFRYEHYQWLVDLDELPRLPWQLRMLARFDARDHLDQGRRGGGIRGDVDRFLAARGIEPHATDRVLMLAHARVLGHAFDPLSVFWCLAADDTVRAVIFEVHNTYGQRHAYLMQPDADGRASVDKAFYVSPFNDTAGRYDVRAVLRPDRVAVRIGLERGGRRVMTASTTGSPIPATSRAIATVAARHALMTQRVSLLIRWHGIRLWLRRLAVQPRPPHSTEENVR